MRWIGLLLAITPFTWGQINNGGGGGGTTVVTIPGVINLQSSYNMSCATVNGSSANTTTSGTVGAGTSIALTSGTGFAAGQGVFINGAGSAGGVYNGIVQSVVSNTITVAPATSTSVTNAVVANYSWPVQTTTSGTVNSGSTSIPVVSASTFSSNQGIYIAGAGASSANYIGTISSVSANAIIVTPATGTTVSNATVQHDESASLNSAITDLTSGVINGTLRMPSGICLFNGALQQTSNANAIIPMPNIIYNPGSFTGANGPTLRISIEGTAAPAWSNYNITGWIGIPSTTGTVIQTSGTSGNLFGAKNPNETDNFTSVHLFLKNLTLRAPDNPAITMVNGINLVGLNVENVALDTLANGAQSTPSQPTNTNGQGLVYPGGNNDAETIGKNIHIQGYYTAITDGEHQTLDHVSLYDNWQGFSCNVNSTFHVGSIEYLDLSDNAYGIVATQACAIYIRGLDNEVSSAPSWATGATNTATIYDPSSFLVGTIEYDSFNGGAARLTRYGAHNVQVKVVLGVANGGNLAWASGLVGTNGTLISGVPLAQIFVNTHCDTPNMSIIPPQSPTNGVAGGCVATGFNFTGRTVQGRIPQVLASNANAYTTFDIGNDQSNDLEIYVNQTTIGFQRKNSGTWVSQGTASYTTAGALYWRMVEASGAVTASFSADGSTWTTIGTCAATCTTWSYTSTNVGFSVQYIGSGPTWPGYTVIDSVLVN